MAPVNKKSFREIKVDTTKVEYDPTKKRMRLKTEIGYNVIFEVEPHISVNMHDAFVNGVPEFQTNVVLRPLNIEKAEKPFTQVDIRELLKDRSVIPEYLNYENFTVGFVYANAQNPNNHKWMFEYRKHQAIFWAQHHLGVHLHKVPITTTSWFDGIYHGRFLVQKQDVETVTEDTPGIVTIHGVKKELTTSPSDFSKLIPNDIKNIRLRFNIREDYWYADLLKEGEVISELKPLKIRHITAEGLDFEGIADFAFEKPKVYYLAKKADVIDARIMAETLFLTGVSK